MAIVGRPEAGFNIVRRRREAQQVRFLRQVAQRRAGIDETGSAIRLGEGRGNLQERRFARSVAADEAHALPGVDDEINAVEQRRSTETQRDAGKLDERGRHG